MARLQWSMERLAQKAADVRRDILTLLANAGTGHSGGSLSCTDFGTALFFHYLNVKPWQPSWPDRDYWHFSIGHVSPVIYSLMAERGYFPPADLLQFRQFEGHLQGHPSAHDTPGIEVSAGSLGQGLSVCVGAALASKMHNHPRRIWCIMGDGEQQEGSIWEAVMSASHFKLGNLTGIIDVNRKQIDGDTEEILRIEPLADKYRAFGWDVIDIDGHDMPAILEALQLSGENGERPTVILARTVMGKGVSFMEDDHRWHGRPPTREQAEEALRGLDSSYSVWLDRLGRATKPLRPQA
ncbi:transketolase [bacterium]|nr:transketolase [bacterium]